MTLVGLNSGLTIANETAITKEGSRRLRNDSESHTTSLLDNRERNYRQSSVIVCSSLVYQTQEQEKTPQVNMVFTAAQRTAFFENNDQMGIPHATVVKLQEEGISRPDDLVDFDKDTIKQIADNLRRPAGRIPDPTPGAPAGATIPTPPFVFGDKSVMRLTAATKLVRFYAMVGRPLTLANMTWNTVMRNFNEQWKALEERKENENPDVPKITKALPVIKWTEAFTDYLSRAIGVRMIPLAYVIRPEADVPVAAPALAAGEPYSLEHGSVEQELVARGRLAITGQYAGKDKWAAEIKRQEQLLHTRVWKGQSNFSLEKFIAQHCNAFVLMRACAEHIQYQLPNGHSRVGFLLDAIQTSDAVSRQQWLASGPMTDPMGSEMTLSSQRHTFYHMTR